MGRTACTEPQCLYKGALYRTFYSETGRPNDLCNLTNISILVMTFMHGIYSYIPETIHVTTVYTVLQLFCIYSLCYM